MDINSRLEEKRAEMLDVFANLSAGELKVALPMIEQGAFLAVLCEDLAAVIAEAGVTETYSNGATQSGVKISSELKAYCSALSKLTTITGRLLKLVPEPPKPKKTPFATTSAPADREPYKPEPLQTFSQWQADQEARANEH